MKIAFRVDGGSTNKHDSGAKRGMGHISRCLSLATKLYEHGCEPIFIMRPFNAGIEKVCSKGFKVIQLPVDLDENIEAIHIQSILTAINPQALVIDKLNTTLDYMQSLKETEVYCINIDDLGEGNKMTDLLLCTLVRPPSIAHKNLYSGPAYMVIADIFKNIHKRQKSINASVKHILISMGGSDPEKLTLKTIDAIEAMKIDATIQVIVGSAYTHYQEITQKINQSDKQFIVKSNVDNMHELLYEADLAIISGGVTVYEVAASGTPAIVICQNEHENTNVFEDYNFVVKAGLGTQLSVPEITSIIKSLLEDVTAREMLSENGKKMVDGQGAERISHLIKQLVIN